MKYAPLSKRFFSQDTHTVARSLLGKKIVRITDGKTLSGRITEVESYIGEDDLACHASKGKTARTKIMYGQAGLTYIYLIYGMYYCLNIVTEKTGFPAAVLIRSLEPLEGIDTMQANRKTDKLTNLTTGPGKLCQALEINKSLNGKKVSDPLSLYIVDDGLKIEESDIVSAPRIGIDYAKHCADYPWRYYLKNSPYTSRS